MSVWQPENERFVFIWIGVEYLGTFCSVLFRFRECNEINYIALSENLKSVLQVPQAHRLSIFET